MTSPGVNLATAYINIVPTVAGIDRSMQQVGGKAGKQFGASFGGSLKGIGLAVGGALAAAKIGGYVKDSIQGIAKIQTLQTQTAAVIKSTGGAAQVSGKHIADLAGQIEGLTSTEAESIQNGANLLLTFTNLKNGAGKGNDVFDQTVGIMTDMSRAMGTDTKGAAIKLGKALNDPVKGLASLSKVGVSFTQQQKDQIKALVASGKTMDAQKIILGELQKKFGGSGAAYAKTFTGQMYQLRDAFGDVGEAVAKRALPQLTGLASRGAGVLTYITDLASGTKELPKGVQAGFGAVNRYARIAYGGLNLLATGDFDPKHWAPGIEEDSPIVNGLFKIRDGAIAAGDAIRIHLSAGFDKIAPIVRQVGGTLGKAFVSVFDTLAPVVKELGPSLSSLWVVFNPISVLFKALLPVLPQIAEVIGELAKVFAQGLADALRAVMPLFQTIAGVIKQLMPFVSSLIRSLLPPLVALFKSLTPAIQAILDVIIPLVKQVADFLIPVIKSLVPVFKTAFKIISDVIDTFVKVIKGIIDFITAVFTGQWGKAWEAVKGIFKVVWEGIQKVVKDVWEAITGIIKVAWERFIKPIWEKGIQPALEALGGFFTGLWDTVEDVWGWIQDKISDVWTWIKVNVFDPIGVALHAVGGFFTTLWRHVVDMWDRIADVIFKVWNWIDQHVFTPLGEAFGFIGGLITDLWTGVTKAWDAIGGFFKAIGAAVQEAWDFIVKAITGIGKAIADFLGLGDATNPLTGKGYFDDLLKPPGGARGAVVPGTDPGRRDNMIMGVRSGEAIMVPEWTNAVGGASAVHAMNRAAEAGQLGAYLSGLARGGVADWKVPGSTRDMGTLLVSQAGAKIAANPWVGLVPGLSAVFSAMAQAFQDKAAAPTYSPTAGGTSGGGPFGGTPGNIPSLGTGVEQWRALARKVVAGKGYVGATIDYIVGIMLSQMAQESSGDPNAINLTDINAQQGHPSVGLLQFIPSTFAAYADPGFNSNIYDPESQMRAFMNYVPAAYGSFDYLASIGFGPYDTGGWLPSGVGPVNLTGQPEPVLTGPQWDIARQAIDSLPEGGGETTLEIHTHIGDRELGDVVKIKVHGVLTDMTGQLNRSRAQSDLVGVA